MREKTWSLSDPQIMEKPGMFLRVDVEKGPCELWPVALRHSDETPISFVISTSQSGVVNVYRGEQLVLESVPLVFVMIDATLQISLPDDSDAVCLLYEGTNLIDDAIAEKKSTYVSSLVEPKFYAASSSRSLFRISCHSPSQLSIDMHFDRESPAHTGLAIEHKDGYANIWRDIYRSGAWVAELREKLGYFHYANGDPYTLSFTVMVDEDGQARVRACTSSGGIFKTFPPVICEAASFDWVSVRESYCNAPQPGRFDVEPIGNIS